MNLLHVIILSIVEGITEFLPISSTGHLILVSHLLGIPQTEFLKSFEIIIQLGAILAVAIISLRSLAPTITDWKKVFFAFLPTSIVGFILYKFIKSYLLGNALVVVLTFFLGGIALIILEYLFRAKKFRVFNIAEISNKNATIVGLCQALSVIPGVSRSAATIIGGMSLGMSRETAVTFSFLLAIPTMLAATGLDILKTQLAFSSTELFYLFVGFVVSFFVAYLAVVSFLKFIKQHTFTVFGIYRIAIALLYFLIMRPH